MAKIAVLGYGTVGSGVVEVLETNKNSIEKRAGEGIEVKYVLDLRDFPGDPVQEKIVHDVDIIIQDKEIDVVVEVMGGIEPAFTFVKKHWKPERVSVLPIRHWLRHTDRRCLQWQRKET